MDARDVCAVGDVLAEGLDGTTQQIQNIHHALADRSLRLVGPARGPAEAVHDRVADGLYNTVRAVGPAAVRSGALALGMAIDQDAERIGGSGRGKALLSAFNGVFGDALARRHNGLAVRMSILEDRRVVRPEPQPLTQAFPLATTRLAVFVHGFGETDASWGWFSEASWGKSGVTYGELLNRQRGYTPLYLHYNTGRTLADNGVELSTLLDAVDHNWPVPVHEIVLIGHSAGGRVARAGIRHGNLAGARWVTKATHVVALGEPRHAILAERVVHAGAGALTRLPETRPVARLLDARSAGLKDLGDNQTGPMPGWVEDVRLPRFEAGPRGKPTRPRVGHFRLLNHPAIYDQLVGELSVRSVPARAQAAQGGRSARAAKALRAPRRSQRRSRSR